MKRYELEREIGKQKFENYEKNLKVHYESYRKHLDIQLATSMPHQMNVMKTILWVDLLMLGLFVQVVKDTSFSLVHLLFYVPVSISVSLVIIALLKRRYKYYGTHTDMDLSIKLYDEEFAVTDMLGTLIKNCSEAIDKNAEIMADIAKFMHTALWSTLLSTLMFILVFALAVTLEGNKVMAEKKPKAPSQQTTTTVSSSEARVERGVDSSQQKSQPKHKPTKDD